MSDDTTNPSASESRKPPYIAYAVIDRGDGKKSKWREIGVALPHKDGKGFDILTDVQPLNGRITLRGSGQELTRDQPGRAPGARLNLKGLNAMTVTESVYHDTLDRIRTI